MKEIDAMIPYKDIVVREGFNSRRSMRDIDKLAENIEKNGLIQPLTVRETGPDKEGQRKYVLIAGERRYRALGLLKRATVRVNIRKVNEVEAQDINLAENEEREELPPLDRAARYKQIMQTQKLSQAELAKKVGKSEAHVSQALSLLKNMAPEIQAAIADGSVTATIAREVSTLPHDQQREVLEEAKTKSKTKGKAASLADLKDGIEEKKAKTGRPKRGKAAQTFDYEKIKVTKEAYGDSGTELKLRPKQALFEVMGQLLTRLENPSLGEDRKQEVKAKIAALEFALGQRDKL